MPDYKKLSLALHKKNKGKLEVSSKVKVNNKYDLSLAYTPGVAAPCLEIAKDRKNIYKYTPIGNSVAVVTDGSAVLGLGNIGAEAAYPVMEGKAVLFKKFGGVDAYPICLSSQKVEDIVKAVELIAPGFGGINLEDISAPRCFEVEEQLKRKLNIPVFHDDQHGTAVVVLAGLINALKIRGNKMGEIKIVISGAGAAGMAITNLLLRAGARNIILCDSQGAIYDGRKEGMNPYKDKIAKKTNQEKNQGSIHEVIKKADVFIGVSAPNILAKKDIENMNERPIVFAMANPVPEIDPKIAKEAGALVVATGRSDYPNQINNVLAFPSIFRGVLDSGARQITEEMKLAAAETIAKSVKNISANNIVPSPFDKKSHQAVARAIYKCGKLC